MAENGAILQVEVLAEPIKSDTDKKQYRSIRLPNGLRALLISDTYSQGGCNENGGESGKIGEKRMAAASLSVGCGNFCDPDQLPGLAHFVEHMLSMGTEKYPEENEFNVFISNGGGFYNASTDSEKTKFYFDIHNEHMQPALDRFAQQFVSPLIRVESMQRERQAIENEFNDRKPNDSCRYQQLLRAIARAGHPISRFQRGNMYSLSSAGCSLSDEQINMELHKFWRQYYCAPYMCLAVQAGQSLDTLQQWVVSSFSDVRYSEVPRPSFTDSGTPWKMSHFHRLYKVVPVKDDHYLRMMWQLPSLVDQYRSDPLEYISDLISHEGRGSIWSYLKKNNWATHVLGGNHKSGFEYNSSFSTFNVIIKLTDLGLQQLEDVVCSIWAYMSMLRRLGPQDRIFREISRIGNMSFKHMEESSPQSWVCMLSRAMLDYSPEDYICANFVSPEFDRELIEQCINSMLPSTCNVTVISKTFENVCDQTEFWFGTSYTSTVIPDSWLNCDLTELEKLFYLPEENPFIAEKLELFSPPKIMTSNPQRIIEETGGELFYRFDCKFRLPRACIFLKLNSNLPLHSAYNLTMCSIFNTMLTFALSEQIYPALLARISFKYYWTESGYIIHLTGFNDKLHDVLYLIVDYLAQFEQRVMSAKLLTILKQTIHKLYMNHMLSVSNLVMDLMYLSLKQQHWTFDQKYREVLHITEQSLLEFVRQFRSSLYVRMLVQGNVQQEHAMNMYKTVKQRLQCQPLPREELYEMRVVQLPLHSDKYVRIASLNRQSTTSCVWNYYQGSAGIILSKCTLRLLLRLMKEPAFDYLRTKEQLGYSVRAQELQKYGVLGLVICVQFSVDKFTADHVDAKIEEFLNKFDQQLVELSQEEFDTVRESLISDRRCEIVSLTQETYSNWNEISQNLYLFDRESKEIEALSTIQHEDVVEMFRSLVSKSPVGSRRKISFQVVGVPTSSSSSPGTPMNDSSLALTGGNSESTSLLQFLAGDTPERDKWISNMVTFKNSLPLLPVSKIVQ